MGAGKGTGKSMRARVLKRPFSKLPFSSFSPIQIRRKIRQKIRRKTRHKIGSETCSFDHLSVAVALCHLSGLFWMFRCKSHNKIAPQKWPDPQPHNPIPLLPKPPPQAPVNSADIWMSSVVCGHFHPWSANSDLGVPKVAIANRCNFLS